MDSQYNLFYAELLTTQYIRDKTYELVVAYVKGNNGPSGFCGTDEMHEIILQAQYDYDHNVLYRHCDGTIMSFRQLKDEDKWRPSEWKRIDK